MTLLPDEPKFHVVFHLGGPQMSDFKIGGVFSKREDAVKYSDEVLANPAYLGVAYVDVLTMQQIKERAAQEYLSVFNCVLEKK
jgi:hypothetical protein